MCSCPMIAILIVGHAVLHNAWLIHPTIIILIYTHVGILNVYFIILWRFSQYIRLRVVPTYILYKVDRQVSECIIIWYYIPIIYTCITFDKHISHTCIYNLIRLIEFNPTVVWGSVTAPSWYMSAITLSLELEYMVAPTMEVVVKGSKCGKVKSYFIAN